MFGKIIRKISSFNRTVIIRGFNEIKSINEMPTIFPRSVKAFEDLVDSENIFVDKSLLIEKLLKSNKKAYLFTRPRRWGKSLNLDMLETFFQADVDQKTGKPNFDGQSKKQLFEKLNISKSTLKKDLITGKVCENDILEFQGKFPVIKVTFRHISPTDKQSMILEFVNMLLPTFEKHKYLLNSNKSSLTAVRELMNLYLNTNRKEIGCNELCRSLEYLINALYNLYNRKVVLLIDEFDRTITNLYAAESPLCKDVIDLTKGILNPIKNNKMLLFTVYAGATRLAKAEIFTGLNHFIHDSVFQSSFSEFFGFTEVEVDLLIKKLILLKLTLSEKVVKNSVESMYNGYRIGNQTIYNPWSIMHCLFALKEGLDAPYSKYWIQVGSTTLIEEAVMKIPTTDRIEELIINGQTEFIYDESFTFEDINIKEVALLSFLLNSGYITKDENNVYKIPNFEVRSCFFEKFLPSWLKKHFLEQNTEFLLDNFADAKKYCKAFQQEFLDKKRYKFYNEAYFKILVAFPFVNQDEKKAIFELQIQQVTNKNKIIDVLITSINGKSNSVFILELKKTEYPGSTKKIIKDALLQVFSKNYASYVLEVAEQPENSHWTSFHIRALVLSPNRSKKKWIITIKELIFNKEGLQKACETYNLNKSMGDEIIELLSSFSSSISEYPSKSNK